MLKLTRVLDIGIAVGILITELTLGANAQTPSAIGRGQFIAAEKCGGCHTVGTTVQGTAVPSFREIAARPNLTAERLKDVIMTPKHPMPATPLASAEIDAVVAYIRSLR
jgi:mono/diheme cytochrome c family protein